jgi:hypothetical protein
MGLMVDGAISFLGGLIQAAVGSAGGLGAMPRKRSSSFVVGTIEAKKKMAVVSR